MTWKVVFGTIGNLWQDEGFAPTKSVIVVTDSTQDELADVQFGFGRVDDTWYKVVCVGDGKWDACWSDRQQRFVTVEDESFIARLNETAGLQGSANN